MNYDPLDPKNPAFYLRFIADQIERRPLRHSPKPGYASVAVIAALILAGVLVLAFR